MVVGDFAIELDTVVIGSGPGGYVAAIRAAEKGQKVTVIEKGDIGGVCLNVGCIPSKALINASRRYQEAIDGSTFGITSKDVTIDFKETQSWIQNDVVKTLTSGISMLFKKHKIDVMKGEAFLMGSDKLRLMTDESSQTIEFKHLIIATGSRPNELPNLKFKDRIIDSTGALRLEEIPGRLIVIGGGYIGAELAGAYANLGAKVTILDVADHILTGFDPDMNKLVIDEFKRKKVDIVTSIKDLKATQSTNEVMVEYTLDNQSYILSADYVLVSAGRKPNTDNLGLEVAGIKMNERGQIIVDNQGRTNLEHIYAIGDVVPGPPLAHKASYEAKVAAEAISGEKVQIDYKAIPAICFTHPELASVGYTKDEAQKAGFDIKVSNFPFAANGRALALNETDGFVRLITEKENHRILGGQIVGPGAGDLIGEIVMAIEAGMSTEDLALIIHAHPTLGETIMDDSELELGYPIHI